MSRKYIILNEDQNEKRVAEKSRSEKKYATDFDELKARFHTSFIETDEFPEVEAESSPFGVSTGKYPAPPMDDETREKVARMKEITLSIEKKESGEESVEAIPDLAIDYKAELNARQFQAATLVDGPALVIAGAGSGKTRTLIYRIAYLLERGVDPSNLLILTFTRKAANEMLERAGGLLGSFKSKEITGGTFHAFSNFILRRYSSLIGIDANFSICDQVDSADIIDLIRREMKFDTKKRFPTKSKVFSIISRSRNQERSIENILEREERKYIDFKKEIETIAELYKSFKESNRIMDYDDLLDVLAEKLKENDVFRERIQERYRYIMVDEFQDTNVIQKRIVDLIAAKYRNVMVVGDDSQSIYGFRGAHFENILLFPETYPDSVVIKLEQNYRSNQNILDYTNAIVDNAVMGYRKRLFSELEGRNRPVCRILVDAEDEAKFIAEKIDSLRREIPLKDMAVLYRSSFHGNYIQAELMKRNIPFQVFGGIKFVERRHIKDVISYMKIVHNPFDAVAWNRVLKLLPGVGNVTAGNIIRAIKENGGKLFFETFRKKKFYKELISLAETLGLAAQNSSRISSVIDIVKGHYVPLLASLDSEYEDRVRDLDILFRLGEKYDSLEKFLTDFALDPPSTTLSDSETPLIEELDEAPLTLSTVHSAKGLEWNTVFVPHLLDGFFPSEKSIFRMEMLEEERRLFYVACSRAKERLFLTLPSSMNFWQGNLSLPSRFLVEISESYFEMG